MAIYFYFGLSIRTLEVTVTSIVKFLITCLVSEILKDKCTGLVICHVGFLKKSMMSQQGKILFSKTQLVNLFNVKSVWICMHTLRE